VDRAKEAAAFLVQRGLLEENEYGEGIKYVLTGQGGQFLNALKTVKKYLEEEE
jgi:predicted transcriptional regulator